LITFDKKENFFSFEYKNLYTKIDIEFPNLFIKSNPLVFYYDINNFIPQYEFYLFRFLQ